jgi:hypothetical protein
MVPEYQDPDIREVLEGQYRVIYEVTASEIQVLAVIHGAQLLPPEPPREPSAYCGKQFDSTNLPRRQRRNCGYRWCPG